MEGSGVAGALQSLQRRIRIRFAGQYQDQADPAIAVTEQTRNLGARPGVRDSPSGPMLAA